MNGKALQRMPAVAAGSTLAAAMLLAALVVGPVADAGAAADQSRAGKAKKQRNAKKGKRKVKKPFGKSGPVYACVKVHGRGRGVVRLVRHPRACRRLSGWHRLSWDRLGGAGPRGLSLQGPPGPPGGEGDRGARGEDGDDAQVGELVGRVTDLEALVAKLEGDLGATEGLIAGLTGELVDLEGVVGEQGSDLVDLEGTVATACTQLTTLTDQANSLLASLEGIELIGGLVELVFGTALPAALEEFACG